LQFQSCVLLAACLGGGNPLVAADPSGDPGLLVRLGSVPDPRGRQPRRYGLATLLALGVCAMSAAGHDPAVAIAPWGRSARGQVQARPGAPSGPRRGVYQVPDDKTLRDAYAKAGASALAAAGSARLPALAQDTRAGAATPDGQPEREQRRRARRFAGTPARPRRRAAFAVDGTCLRGAKRPDGSQIYVISAVRHHDRLTAAAREIPAKSSGIPAFAPLLAGIDDGHLRGAVVTMDALHAQRDHAACPAGQRHAHYLAGVTGNQPNLREQLPALPRGPGPGGAPQPRRRPQPAGAARAAGPHRPRPAVPARPPGAADHPAPPCPGREEVNDQDRLRHHRPGLGAGHRPRTGRMGPAGTR
jgi:hypothetical protein